MPSAFFCPISTSSRFPRVIPVWLRHQPLSRWLCPSAGAQFPLFRRAQPLLNYRVVQRPSFALL